MSASVKTSTGSVSKQIGGGVRFLAWPGVVGLLLSAIGTFVWASAKAVKLASDLLKGGWRNDLKIVDLLEVVDSYLLAVVLLIVVIGLYELFIGDLDVPEWLVARSLDDLKKSIIDVLIVFMGVKGVEGLVSIKKPIDALAYSGAVAVLIVALTIFRSRPKPSTK